MEKPSVASMISQKTTVVCSQRFVLPLFAAILLSALLVTLSQMDSMESNEKSLHHKSNDKDHFAQRKLRAIFKGHKRMPKHSHHIHFNRTQLAPKVQEASSDKLNEYRRIIIRLLKENKDLQDRFNRTLEVLKNCAPKKQPPTSITLTNSAVVDVKKDVILKVEDHSTTGGKAESSIRNYTAGVEGHAAKKISPSNQTDKTLPVNVTSQSLKKFHHNTKNATEVTEKTNVDLKPHFNAIENVKNMTDEKTVYKNTVPFNKTIARDSTLKNKDKIVKDVV